MGGSLNAIFGQPDPNQDPRTDPRVRDQFISRGGAPVAPVPGPPSPSSPVASAPVASQPQTIDEIMRPFLDAHAAREKAFADLVKGGTPPPAPMGRFWGGVQKAAAVAGAAGAGFSHNPRAMEVGQDILDPDRLDRERAFQTKVRGEESGLSEEERRLNLQRETLESGRRETREQTSADEAKKFREFQMGGGPEKAKLDAETAD